MARWPVGPLVRVWACVPGPLGQAIGTDGPLGRNALHTTAIRAGELFHRIGEMLPLMADDGESSLDGAAGAFQATGDFFRGVAFHPHCRHLSQSGIIKTEEEILTRLGKCHGKLGSRFARWHLLDPARSRGVRGVGKDGIRQRPAYIPSLLLVVPVPIADLVRSLLHATLQSKA